MWFRRDLLVRKAEKLLRSHQPIPLDLYVKLLEEGVDVDELDRVTKRD